MDDYSKDWEKVFDNRESERLKQQTKAKSVGRKPTKKRNIKNRFIALALAGVLTITGIYGGTKLKGKLEKVQKINEASDIVKNDAQKILLDNGLAEYDEKGNYIIKENTVADYDRLAIDDASVEALYAFYLATGGNAIEFDKLIQSVQGVDGVHNYTGLSQFYSYNGFDKGTEGGYVEWKKASQNKLVEALENGTINDIVQDESNAKGR